MKVCQCPENENCSASFTLLLYSGIPGGASIIPDNYNNGSLYIYDYGDGPGSVDILAFSYVYATTGNYEVCLTEITENGEVCKSCITICIDTVREGGGRKNNQPIIKPRKGSSIITDVSLYPNPTNYTSTLFYTANKENMITVSISDITGKLIKNIVQNKVEIGKKKVEIDTREFKAGYYIVRINGNNETIVTKLIVIR